MIQKYKRGNKVLVLGGFNDDHKGDEAIISGSYSDLYGGDSDHSKSQYSLVFCKNGNGVAWFDEKHLEFIEEGGEHLFLEASKKRDEVFKELTNLDNIVNNWNNQKINVSSQTILFLFDKIGFKTSFLNNGEYFVLQDDFWATFEVFDMLINSDNIDDVIGILPFVFKDPSAFEDKVREFYTEIQLVKKSC